MNRKALVVLGLVGVWWSRHSGEAQTWEQPVMAAVAPGGFAALVGPRDVHDSWRIVDMTRAGESSTRALRLEGHEVRLVGTRAGVAVGWIDNKRLKLGVLDDEGTPRDASTWGKKAVRLCDGAASNELRFGVGWLESDGRVWFVHGLLGQTASAPEAEEIATKGEWCGIASGEGNVVLMWRENGRLVMNFCGRKDCTTGLVGVPIDRGDALLGFGCISDSCMFATRDKQGTTKLVRVNIKGRVVVRPIEDAAPDTKVSVTGAGHRAFAIAYIARDQRATTRRVTVDGTFTSVYHFAADFAPSIAWAADQLFVVTTHYAADASYLLDMPR